METIILPYDGADSGESKTRIVEAPKKEKTSSRQWTEYNLYQTQEKMIAYKIINDIVDYLQLENKKDAGRPNVDINDLVKSLLVKAYNDLSARRLHSELVFYRGMGYIDNVYHFNTVLKYLRDPCMMEIFDRIYKELAVPLKEIESYFAVDATGFSTLDKSQWSEVRLDFKQHKDYRKLHMTCGVKTNIIVAAYVTDGTAADSPYFKPMLNDTVKVFNVKEISADAGYLSRENCTAAKDVGAVPYIMPKKNSIKAAKGSSAWHHMIQLWQENPDKFREHYHRRSNAESTFSMMKRKFGSVVRGKYDTTKHNEIMCKICCHNISVLVEAMLIFGAKPHF